MVPSINGRHYARTSQNLMMNSQQNSRHHNDFKATIRKSHWQDSSQISKMCDGFRCSLMHFLFTPDFDNTYSCLICGKICFAGTFTLQSSDLFAPRSATTEGTCISASVYSSLGNVPWIAASRPGIAHHLTSDRKPRSCPSDHSQFNIQSSSDRCRKGDRVPFREHTKSLMGASEKSFPSFWGGLFCDNSQSILTSFKGSSMV
jgi:hypothetical protein